MFSSKKLTLAVTTFFIVVVSLVIVVETSDSKPYLDVTLLIDQHTIKRNLHLTEHVWNGMKEWIKDYFAPSQDVASSRFAVVNCDSSTLEASTILYLDGVGSFSKVDKLERTHEAMEAAGMEPDPNSTVSAKGCAEFVRREHIFDLINGGRKAAYNIIIYLSDCTFPEIVDSVSSEEQIRLDTVFAMFVVCPQQPGERESELLKRWLNNPELVHVFIDKATFEDHLDKVLNDLSCSKGGCEEKMDRQKDDGEGTSTKTTIFIIVGSVVSVVILLLIIVAVLVVIVSRNRKRKAKGKRTMDKGKKKTKKERWRKQEKRQPRKLKRPPLPNVRRKV